MGLPLGSSLGFQGGHTHQTRSWGAARVSPIYSHSHGSTWHLHLEFPLPFGRQGHTSRTGSRRLEKKGCSTTEKSSRVS